MNLRSSIVTGGNAPLRALEWFHEYGVGYYPVDPFDEPYRGKKESAREYHEKYERYAESSCGVRLTIARANVCEKLLGRPLSGVRVLDWGSAACQFLEYVSGLGARVWGCDVNPYSRRLLEERGWLFPREWDPRPPVDLVTAWDVMEHLVNPETLLIAPHVCVSTPWFDGPSDVLNSVHFRTDEHRWYFTVDGLLKWFRNHGYEPHVCCHVETDLGRKKIVTVGASRVQTI